MTDLIFTRRFSMAHRLLADRSDKCATPHGHNEFVKVTLRPRPDTPAGWGTANQAADFARLKRHWHQFIDKSLDHAFQLGAADPLIGYFRDHEPDLLPRLLILKGDPTTEALAVALYAKCQAILACFCPDFTCVGLDLEETPTNTVRLSPDDGIAPFDLGAWTHRADLSLNDLVPPSVFGDWS